MQEGTHALTEFLGCVLQIEFLSEKLKFFAQFVVKIYVLTWFNI